MSVVVGYIPDEYGEAALEAGLREAQRRGSALVVVNATQGDALVDERYLGDRARGDLEQRLASAPVPVEVRRSMGADVASEVLAVVREVDAEMLVIGLRRRTPVGKVLMGSVATRLLMQSACPVLAVKP
jgi:nucleotide-binding universal stress UspA family protein